MTLIRINKGREAICSICADDLCEDHARDCLWYNLPPYLAFLTCTCENAFYKASS